MRLDARFVRQHAARLRALARSLLRDQAAADDAVQDAWVRALERPPREGMRLPGWLRVVVRNRARESRREAGRRRAREQRAARPEQVGDDAARLAACRRVLDAVEALEPKYRRIVLLRYFEELPPRAIAQRLGVPVNTVRTRLQRALRQLRARLDGEDRLAGGDGGDRSWRAALLPLVVPQRAAAAGTGLTAGALLMLSKVELAAVFVVCGTLAALAALLWPDAPPDARRSATAESPHAPALVVAGREAELGPAQPAIPPDARVAVAPAHAAWELRGRAVLDGPETPAAGVTLALRLFAGTNPAGAPLCEGRLTTAADGTFAWRPTAPTATAVAVVESASELCVARLREPVVLPGGAPPRREIAVRVTALDAVVHGTVTDEAGAPVAAAFVHLVDVADALTGEDGGYRIRVPARADGVTLHVAAPGHAATRLGLQSLHPGDDVRCDVVLGPGFTVEGTVRDENGAPIADAAVQASHAFSLAVRSGSDGRYAIRHVDPHAGEVHVFAEHPRYLQGNATVAVRGESARCDLTLRNGVRVEGRVVTETGAPVEGARIYFSPSGLNNREADATSGADGTFAIPAAKGDVRTLVVRADGFGITFLPLEIPASARRIGDVLAVVRPGRTIRGVVRDGAGAPITGVAVFAEREVQPRGEKIADLLDRYANGLGLVAHTGPDGAFAVDDLPHDALTLTFVRDGFVRAERARLGGESSTLEVVLERTAGFAGLVVDAQTGAPVPRFAVRLVRAEMQPGDRPIGSYGAGWAHGIEFDAPDGRWHTGEEEFHPGEVTGVEVRADGYAPALVPRLVATRDPRPQGCVVPLEAGGGLEGRVVSAVSGAPIADAYVLLFTAQDRVHGLSGAMPSRAVARARTDGQGRFVFAHVRPGRIRLAVRRDGVEPYVDEELEVRAGGRRHRTLRVR